MNDHNQHKSNSRATCNPALVGVHAVRVARLGNVKPADDARVAN